ncbi:alpha-2-macroglobulin [Paraburkholderia sp. BCC1876]|uniref:alpha-2-macroglobulin family protein n=1 Tax=Paraburkholderia sp. BCC1876 TaxID=2676303 RepID=UPI001592623A|nr:alpha-2-macroglobulin [Paraburkholderia sp. BCC1876]
MKKNYKRGLAAAFLLIVAALAIWAMVRYLHGGHAEEADVASDPNTPFTVIDAANRELDGHPALALTFSQPLDAGTDYDKVVRVFKMPSKGNAKTTASTDSEDSDDSAASAQGASAASEVSTSEKLTDLAGGVAVSGAWVVGDNPRLLYFPHVEPLTHYVVQIQDTLTGKDGRKLGREVRYSINTPAVSPAFYFASRGMVLPAKESGGLPVVTVNVPEVDVQFMRVRPDQLPRFIDAMLARKQPSPSSGDDDDSGDNSNQSRDPDLNSDLHGAVSLWSLDGLHKMADSVYQGRFLTEQQTDRRSVTYLPVETIKALQEPGIYVAVMSQPGRFRYEYQTTYYYVSDLGLHLRLFDHAAEAFVSSLTDGSAVSNVDITWLDRQGKVLGRGQTDGDGHASFAKQPDGAALVLAQKEGQMSVLSVHEAALDLGEFDIAGSDYKLVRLFAWSGRDLYRPGETFTMSVLARDADGRPVPPQPLQATLRRADGKTQFVSTWQPVAGRPGYYQQKITLPGDAPTGGWALELRNDPASKAPNATVKFKVEEFLPERMKLDLASPSAVLAPGQAFHVDVTGMYLYGAPAAGNRLLGVAEFERDKNPLNARYPGFEFGDANDDALHARQQLDDQALDDNGKLSFEIPADPAKDAHSPVTVRATLSLLESGGRPVVRNLERTIWPAPVLTAVRPLFTGDYAPENSPTDFEVIRVDQTGNPKAAKGLQVRMFRENRDYYWRFDDQRGWNSGFTDTDELMYTGVLDIPAGGRGQLHVPVKYGRYRLELFDAATGLTQRYRFYAGWNAQTNEQAGQRPDRVTLKLDRDAYRSGDTAHLTITPPHAGSALITVDGDRTLWTKRVKIDGASSTVDIPVEPAWQRHDLYVNVMVLRPGNEGDLVTPARALGLIALPLERQDRRLDVSIDAPAKVKSETVVKIKVKVPAAKGQSAMLTLSAVDVGILNITKFPVPDPFQGFFGKLQYGADLHDIYGRLIEKLAGKKGKLKWGGDTTPKSTQDLPKKVKLVDLFTGPITLDANGEADIPLTLPDFNGTLRLAAVVATADRFGSQSQEMVVAAPVIAELSTPRYLNFGDHSTLALDVQNLTGGAGTFRIDVKAQDGLTVQNGSRDVTLRPQQKVTLRYDVDAGDQQGLHAIDVAVQGAGVALTRHYALEVEAPTPSIQQTLRYTIDPGATLTIRDPAIAGLYPGSLSAHLFVSNTPPVDVKAAVKWLLEYPYGCAEQATSSAYPWLYVDEAAAKRYGLKVYTREERAQRIDFALGKLGGYQSAHGGFSLWGNTPDDFWLSAYVTGFLQDARAQGFAVPDALYSKATAYLLRGLQEGSAQITPLPTHVTPDTLRQLIDDVTRNNRSYEALVQAAYVLAHERKAPLATLRLLFDQRVYANSGLSLVELGIALNLMGDNARGQQAIAQGLKVERRSGYWWWDYGSNLRDQAMEFVLLRRDNIQAPQAATLLGRVQGEMAARGSYYFSTQERLALFRLGQSLASEEPKPWRATIDSASGTRSVDSVATQFADVSATEFAQGLTVTNPSDQHLFVELALSGSPVHTPQPASGVPQISLTREYRKADGTALGNETLKIGDTVLVHLHASAASYVTASAIVVDRIPAGLEIENANLVQGENGDSLKVDGINVNEAMQSNRIQHVEFRDDRFVAAVKLGWGSLDLFYRARVVTPGQYTVPPLFAQDMYRPEVFGVLDPQTKMTIVDSAAPAPVAAASATRAVAAEPASARATSSAASTATVN